NPMSPPPVLMYSAGRDPSCAYSEYARPLVDSFMMTLRQPDSAVGRTHASSVMPVVRSSVFESAMFTRLEGPLNVRAWPYFPARVQVAPDTVPVLPLPDLSFRVVPVPSLKLYAATSPVDGGGPAFETVTVIVATVEVFPAASRPTAVNWCDPLVAVVVS